MNRWNVNKDEEAGFSMIELMIVVAIIGILAAVAIPNYQTFIRRSKQAEVKSNLSQFYTASRTFHGEWSFYPGAFQHVGFEPEGDLIYRYHTADFGTTGVAARYQSRKGNAITLRDVHTGSFCARATTNCAEDAATMRGVRGADRATSETAFLMGSAAFLGRISNGNQVVDRWTVNESKQIVQVANGE